MENTRFRIESNRAEMMARAAPGQAAYWTGYGRGLRHAQFGNPCGDDDEHRRYMREINSPDPNVSARAHGYQDGLIAAR